METPENVTQVSVCVGKKDILACHRCQFTCHDETSMILHLVHHHDFTDTSTETQVTGFLYEGDLYCCQACAFLSPSRLMFQEHIRCHTFTMPYTCAACSQAVNLKHVHAHYDTSHSSKLLAPAIHVASSTLVDEIMQKLGPAAPISISEIPVSPQQFKPSESSYSTRNGNADRPDTDVVASAYSSNRSEDPLPSPVGLTDSQLLQKVVTHCNYTDGSFVCGLCKFSTLHLPVISKHFHADVRRWNCNCVGCRSSHYSNCIVITAAITKIKNKKLQTMDKLKVPMSASPVMPAQANHDMNQNSVAVPCLSVCKNLQCTSQYQEYSKKHKPVRNKNDLLPENKTTEKTHTNPGEASHTTPSHSCKSIKAQTVKLLCDLIDDTYVCKSCNFYEKDATLFRKHLWDDIHQCGDCTHNDSNVCSGIDNNDCTILNSLMQMLLIRRNDIDKHKRSERNGNVHSQDEKSGTRKVPSSKQSNEADSTGGETTESAHNQEVPEDKDICDSNSTPMSLDNIVEQDSEESEFFKCGFINCRCSFSVVTSLKKHILNDHKTMKVFPCPYCSCLWPDYNHLLEHIPAHIGPTPYRCVQCDVCFATNSLLKDHLNKMHCVNKLFKCTFSDCKFVSNIWTEFKMHNFTFHSNEVSYTCFACDAKISSLSSYFWHIESGMVTLICCSYCPMKSKMRHTILRHSNSVHQGLDLKITVQTEVKCAKDTEIASSKSSHVMPSSEKMVVYKCGICDYANENKTSTMEHINCHEICSSLQLAFSCPFCPFSAAGLDSFKAHLADHRSKSTHYFRYNKCTHCLYTSNQMALIEKHLQEKHTNKLFKFEVQQEVVFGKRNKYVVQHRVVGANDGPSGVPEQVVTDRCAHSKVQQSVIQSKCTRKGNLCDLQTGKGRLSDVQKEMVTGNAALAKGQKKVSGKSSQCRELHQVVLSKKLQKPVTGKKQESEVPKDAVEGKDSRSRIQKDVLKGNCSRSKTQAKVMECKNGRSNVQKEDTVSKDRQSEGQNILADNGTTLEVQTDVVTDIRSMIESALSNSSMLERETAVLPDNASSNYSQHAVISQTPEHHSKSSKYAPSGSGDIALKRKLVILLERCDVPNDRSSTKGLSKVKKEPVDEKAVSSELLSEIQLVKTEIEEVSPAPDSAQRHTAAIERFHCELCAFSCSEWFRLHEHIKASHENVTQWNNVNLSVATAVNMDLPAHPKESIVTEAGVKDDVRKTDADHGPASEEMRYHCNLCTFICELWETFQKHIVNDHSYRAIKVDMSLPFQNIMAIPIEKAKPVATSLNFLHGRSVCDSCSYSTDMKTNMLEHKIGHSQKLKSGFKCRYCSYSSTHEDVIKRHVKSCHPEKPLDQPHVVSLQARKTPTINKKNEQMRVCTRQAKSKLFVQSDVTSKSLDLRSATQSSEEYDEHAESADVYLRNKRCRYKDDDIDIDEEGDTPAEDSQWNWRHHIMASDNQMMSCRRCAYRQIGVSQLRQHILSAHTRFSPFGCKYCDFATTEIRYVREHIEKIHPGLPCNVVRRKYVIESDTEVHNEHTTTAVTDGVTVGRALSLTALADIGPTDGTPTGTSGMSSNGMDLDKETDKGCNTKTVANVAVKTELVPSQPMIDTPLRQKQHPKYYRCIYCDFRTEDRFMMEIREHIFVVHLQRDHFLCTHCTFSSMKRDDVVAHNTCEHPDKTNTVREDRTYARNIAVLETHGDIRMVGVLSNDKVPLIELPSKAQDEKELCDKHRANGRASRRYIMTKGAALNDTVGLDSHESCNRTITDRGMTKKRRSLRSEKSKTSNVTLLAQSNGDHASTSDSCSTPSSNTPINVNISKQRLSKTIPSVAKLLSGRDKDSQRLTNVLRQQGTPKHTSSTQRCPKEDNVSQSTSSLTSKQSSSRLKSMNSVQRLPSEDTSSQRMTSPNVSSDSKLQNKVSDSHRRLRSSKPMLPNDEGDSPKSSSSSGSKTKRGNDKHFAQTLINKDSNQHSSPSDSTKQESDKLKHSTKRLKKMNSDSHRSTNPTRSLLLDDEDEDSYKRSTSPTRSLPKDDGISHKSTNLPGMPKYEVNSNVSRSATKLLPNGDSGPHKSTFSIKQLTMKNSDSGSVKRQGDVQAPTVVRKKLKLKRKVDEPSKESDICKTLTSDADEKYTEASDSVVSWKCKTCNLQLAKLEKMRHHVIMHHMNMQPYRCAVCDFADKKMKLVVAHIRRKHCKSRIHIPVLNMMDEKSDCLRKKMIMIKSKSVETKRLRTSRRNGAQFNYNGLRVKDGNGDTLYRCDLCDHQVRVKASIVNHRKSHFKFHPYGCGYCDYRTSNKFFLQSHSNDVHAGLPMKIRTIRKSDDNDSKRKLNENSEEKMKKDQVAWDKRHHSPSAVEPQSDDKLEDDDGLEPTFMCQTCGKKMLLKTSLERHVMVAHLGYRPYRCSGCDYSAVNKGTILTHIVKKHEGTSCSAVYKKDEGLDAKVKTAVVRVTDTVESALLTSFVCVICKTYKTNSRSSITSHIAEEIKYTPHQCSYCLFSSSKRNVVTSHVLEAHPLKKVVIKFNERYLLKQRVLDLTQQSVVKSDSDLESDNDVYKFKGIDHHEASGT